MHLCLLLFLLLLTLVIDKNNFHFRYRSISEFVIKFTYEFRSCNLFRFNNILDCILNNRSTLCKCHIYIPYRCSQLAGGFACLSSTLLFIFRDFVFPCMFKFTVDLIAYTLSWFCYYSVKAAWQRKFIYYTCKESLFTVIIFSIA